MRKYKAVEHKRRVNEKGLTVVLEELKQRLQTKGSEWIKELQIEKIESSRMTYQYDIA